MSASLLGLAASTKFEKSETILSNVVLVLLSARKTERIKSDNYDWIIIHDHRPKNLPYFAIRAEPIAAEFGFECT